MDKTIKIALAVVIAVAGLAAGFFTRQYLDGGSAKGGTPEQNVASAFEGLTDIKTLTYEGKVTIGEIPPVPSDSAPHSPIVVTFSGAGDSTDPIKPNALFNLSVVLPPDSGLDAFIQAGQIAIETITIKDVLYLKLAEAPAIGFFDISKIIGVWIKMDLKEIQNTYAPDSSALDTNDPKLLAAANKFKNAVLSANLLKITKTYPTEAIAGESSHHYGFSVDKNAVLALMPAYREFVAEMGTPISDAEFAEVEKTIKETPQEQFPSGEIWIGMHSLQLRQVKLTQEIKPETAGNYTSPGVKFEIVLTITGINKPVTIEAPAPFITMEEAYERLMNSSASGVGSGLLGATAQLAQARNTQRSANINALLNAIGQNMADNRGKFVCKTQLPAQPTIIASKGGVDLAPCLVPTYLPSMPFDPTEGVGFWTSLESYRTGYTVSQSGGPTGRVTVTAPSAEEGKTISVTR